MTAETDAFAADLALRAPEPLRAFNAAGVLTAADVHVARRLAALVGEEDGDVLLAAALAVRGPRMGHVLVELATARETAAVDEDADVEVDIGALPWPEPADWEARVARSPLVARGEEDAADVRPLRLVDGALYLDRYWREERAVAADLRGLADAAIAGVDAALLQDGIGRLFGADPDGLQARACRSAVTRRLTVVAGGPGTGKTTTVARIVALLAEQARAAGDPPPLVALAAPTGKAAARLEEAVHEQAAGLDVDPAIRDELLGLRASTLHRLLGWRPDSQSRFRHERANRLPHDVVVVDETSMVSLTLMARLAEAVRPDARLVLVGDPGQLTSIEAGAVLGDIVGAGVARPGIVVLEQVHRYGRGIAVVAEAVRRGDADAAVAALRDAADVTWIETDAADGDDPALAPLRAEAVGAARAVIEAARTGDAHAAITRLGAFRLLCAHRLGDHGVATWADRIERWLAAEVPGFAAAGRWYAGRPLLVTENDYGLRLYNGDTGVVVATGPASVTAAFERGGGVVEYSPARLGAVETVHAMTVHKSQGSQFGTAAVLLPEPTSQILTRELLYTAVTRAQDRLVVVGGEDAVRAAVARPVARASGLGRRMWGDHA